MTTPPCPAWLHLACGQDDVCGTCYTWGPYRSMWFVLKPETIMSLSYVITRVLIDICGLYHHLRPWWCMGPCCWNMSGFEALMQMGSVLMSVVRVTTKFLEGVGGLCCCLRSCQYAWAVLLIWRAWAAMMMPIGQASCQGLVCIYSSLSAEGHVPGMWCSRKSNGSPWSLLPTDCEVQGDYFCLWYRWLQMHSWKGGKVEGLLRLHILPLYSPQK